MYDELIKNLRVAGDFVSLSGYQRDLMREAADAIEVLVATVGTAYNELANNEANKPRWIPMTERPPEEELRFYSCYTNKGVVVECLWTNNKYGLGPCGEWGWRLMDVPQYQHITHWMPLPEPPKEEA